MDTSTPSPFVDHAAPILAGDPALSDEKRADLWDIFNQSKSPDELVQHLQPLPVPDDTKHRLWQAKQLSMAPVAPLDAATGVLQKMAQMDPKLLDLAESHPTVFKTLTAAATTPEKGPESTSGSTSGAGKGKQASGDGSSAPLALPPRVDGLAHLPPIPNKHKRLLASDGGIHDVPEENVEKAFSIDPQLHVMNP